MLAPTLISNNEIPYACIATFENMMMLEFSVVNGHYVHSTSLLLGFQNAYIIELSECLILDFHLMNLALIF
jgi:hypothetical protein